MIHFAADWGEMHEQGEIWSAAEASEYDHQCKEGFGLSRGLNNHTVLWIFEQPTYCTNDSDFSSFLIQMNKLCCLMTVSVHNCEA